MERLTKLLKSTIKVSIITALVISVYVLFQGTVKFPFKQGSIGPQNETQVVIVEKAAPKEQIMSKAPEVASTNSLKLDPSPIKILPMPIKPAPVTKKEEVIILGKKNTLLFRGVVNMLSVAKLQAQVLKMAAKLPPSTPIYLVLDTPGGSVVAGNILVDTLRALPNKVHTITLFSASMGFHIAESLDDRLILPSGTLMSHRMSVGGISGQVPGEAVTAINYAIRLAERMDQQASKRMGMEFNQYREAIRDELWKDGQDAIDFGMADREVLALCGEDLQGTYEEKIDLLFFQITAVWSECPIIRFPISLKLNDLNRSTIIFGPALAEAKRQEYEKFINSMLYDREKFVREYILTNKYKEFMPE